MNPYLSWAILIAVAGSLGWYYNNNGPRSKTKAPVKPIAEKTETLSVAKKQKRKNKKSPEPSPVPTKKSEEKSEKAEPQLKVEEVDSQDEEIDRKELAKRFTAVKTGALSSTSSNAGKSQKKKNKKKSAAAPASQLLESGASERPGSRVSTRASSTTGADADDDLSPAGSPMVNATVPTAGYVSDMLEAPAPAASVLRLTGSLESEPKKQKPQSFKPVETKKQRQQRLKNEERKRQVQEAEQERRKLLEKQLHTAREAERREAAKSKPAPTTNAWATKDVKGTTNGTPKPAQTPKVDLLDTFDNETPSKSKQDAPVASQTPKKWDQTLPSEEEQMRLLGVSSESEWTTVSNKKTKKKGGKSDESVSEASGSESQPTPSAAPLPVEPNVTVTQTYIPDILRTGVKGHPLDSDWVA